MNLKENKKIVLLAIALIIIAGIIVVALKGFNVPLYYHQHESIQLYIKKQVDINDINRICDEVFGMEKYLARTVESFDTSVNISFESITDEQLKSLLNKINEKYETKFVVEKNYEEQNVDDQIVVTIDHNGNVRLREMIKPYVVPTIISGVLVCIYMIIRYRKLDLVKVFSNLIVGEMLLMAVVASVVAIFRIPVTPFTFNVMFMIAVVMFVVFLANREKDLKNN